MPTASALRGGLALLILAVLSTTLSAQQSGRIVGRIVDAEQGAPIAGARVDLVEDSIHAISALDGRYTLAGGGRAGRRTTSTEEDG